MKISEQWLREWVNPSINTQGLADQLTMAGLEVDSINSVAPPFNNVVIGHVIRKEKHPDADRLSCCLVDIGEEAPLEIVCGAANVRKDLKVAVARVGAELPNGLKIKKSKIRGATSEGMICSAVELGIDDSQTGIMELSADAPVGMNFRDYLSLDDHIFEIELTPNRGDCLSMKGVAREVAVLNNIPFKGVEIKEFSGLDKHSFPVTVESFQACPRYVGRVIKNINPKAQTPIWMKERLRRSGIRTIHPIVDICNYVMLELGQPMHAFDLDSLQSGIYIRAAKPQENIVLLDGVQITIPENTLVIADAKKPHAIAGIMGGLESSVHEETKNIFLESAFFEPIGIRNSARRLKLQTDSSYRFERGVDPELQSIAIERATQLILDIVGGEPQSAIEKFDSKELPQQKEILLRKEKIDRVLGIKINDVEVESILKNLGMKVDRTEQGWKIIPPSFRFDITIEADLIEELVRIYGYENVPAHRMKNALEIQTATESKISTFRLADFFVDRGYHEVVTYSFVDQKIQELLNPNEQMLFLENPITQDLGVMRTSMWPGLLQAMIFNENRQANRIRLFESGICFQQQNDKWMEFPRFGALISGQALPELWNNTAKNVDFYDLKADLESLILLTGRDLTSLTWQHAKHPALHPGQSAEVFDQNRSVAILGALHPRITQHLGLNQVPLLLEIDLQWLQMRTVPVYSTVSKFPSVRRDIALVVDQTITAQEVKNVINKSAGVLLKNITVFDVYQGAGIENGKKSMALGLTFQDPNRTLVDTEINEILAQLINEMERRINAKLRT